MEMVIELIFLLLLIYSVPSRSWVSATYHCSAGTSLSTALYSKKLFKSEYVKRDFSIFQKISQRSQNSNEEVDSSFYNYCGELDCPSDDKDTRPIEDFLLPKDKSFGTNFFSILKEVSRLRLMPPKKSKVSGFVVDIDPGKAFIVDYLGLRVGYLPFAELPPCVEGEPSLNISIGNAINATVIGYHKGIAVLSLREEYEMKLISDLRRMISGRETVNITIQSLNRGGAICKYNDFNGFLPISLMMSYNTTKPGQVVEAKILNIQMENRKVLFSQRGLVKVNPGDVLEGTVLSTKPYGYIVSFPGKLTGLLHNLHNILTCAKHLNVNDKVVVVVTEKDNSSRLSLSTTLLINSSDFHANLYSEKMPTLEEARLLWELNKKEWQSRFSDVSLINFSRKFTWFFSSKSEKNLASMSYQSGSAEYQQASSDMTLHHGDENRNYRNSYNMINNYQDQAAPMNGASLKLNNGSNHVMSFSSSHSSSFSPPSFMQFSAPNNTPPLPIFDEPLSSYSTNAKLNDHYHEDATTQSSCSSVPVSPSPSPSFSTSPSFSSAGTCPVPPAAISASIEALSNKMPVVSDLKFSKTIFSAPLQSRSTTMTFSRHANNASSILNNSSHVTNATTPTTTTTTTTTTAISFDASTE